MVDTKGMRALVTGASSGIGAEIARILAARGTHLVLSARRIDRLEALAAELRDKHGVEIDVVAADLGERDAPQKLFDATEGAGRAIDVLINNAGFGTKGAFLDIPIQKTREQMQLNMVALTELAWLFAGAMKTRKRGYILNVASIGAFVSVPGYATYGAGKAYVRSFSEALEVELAPHGIRVTCSCPGPTDTEFMEVAGHTDLASWKKVTFMSAKRCATISINAMLGGRITIVTGMLNALVMWGTRFLPRFVTTRIAARLMG